MNRRNTAFWKCNLLLLRVMVHLPYAWQRQAVGRNAKRFRHDRRTVVDGAQGSPGTKDA